MPALHVPRLYRNRCGVWCFRLRSGAADSRVSLRTKCELSAHMMVAKLNAHIEAVKGEAMTGKNPKLSDLNLDLASLRRYEIDIKNGVFKSSDDADHKRMLEALDRIDRMPAQKADPAPASASQAAPPAAIMASPKLSVVAQAWLAERETKNAKRTVYAKSRHFEEFKKRIALDVEINAITQATMVGFKAALLTDGQKAKLIDNKLMTLHDLFEFARKNGHYTASNTNPVAGLFILTKAERTAKTDPYEPFTTEDLRLFFEPQAYKAGMAEPDYFWGPLLGIYTGMRISEATAIRCDDVRRADNGVYYIFVPKSKTTAGIRSVPVCWSLIELGFLDFAARQKAAGHDRLFPDRLFINESYSKKLSERMKDYLVERGIKRPGDRKSFHSFRVNVITQLADNGVNTAMSMKIVGHASREGEVVHMGYVRELPDMKTAVDGLSWPIEIEALASS